MGVQELVVAGHDPGPGPRGAVAGQDASHPKDGGELAPPPDEVADHRPPLLERAGQRAEPSRT